MTKNELKEYFEKIAAKGRTRRARQNLEIINSLDALYPGVSLNLQIYSIVNNTSPYCICCGVTVKSLGKQTCSTKCRDQISKTHDKVNARLTKFRATNLKKYGVDNPQKSKIIQVKRTETMLKKYGAKVSPRTAQKAKERALELNIKGRKTLKERYGVTNAGQLSTHLEKCQQTLLENYGVKHYYLSEEFKAKSEENRWTSYQLFSPPSIKLLDITADQEKTNLFENPNKVIKFSCDCGNVDALPSETYKWRIRNAGTPCLYCSGINKGSLKEQQIKQFIKSLGLEILENKKLLGNQEIDIFVPEKKIGIEFNGLFWHNDTRVDKKYHFEKLCAAQKQGIKLIHIFEDEWEHKKEIVKQKLTYALGMSNEKIYARKCEVKIINKEQEKGFLDLWHIQGSAKSKIKLGLYFANELVAVMTFAALNPAKGGKRKCNHWELVRFCTRKNVVGGASKLFTFFIKQYQPQHVISYGDLRWGSGKLYQTLGFDYQGNTSLNYWYIDLKNLKRIHRFALRKNKKDDQQLTEYENRLKQGYLRIWDCGNSRWTWTQK